MTLATTANSPKQLESCLCRLLPRLREHDLVAFGIGAHGKVSWLLGRVFGWTQDGATGGAEGVARSEEIADLKGEAVQVRLLRHRCECERGAGDLSSAMISD